MFGIEHSEKISRINSVIGHTSLLNVPQLSLNKEVLYFKDKDKFYAQSAKCPHRGYQLFANYDRRDIDPNDIVCPAHGLHFKNGKCDNFNLLRGELTVVNNILLDQFAYPVLTLPKEVKVLEQEKVTFYHREIVKVSNVDWRCHMENNVDMLHLKHAHSYMDTFVDLHNIRTAEGEDWSWQELTFSNNICSNGPYELMKIDSSNSNLKTWWLYLYPYTMIEWQAGFIGISTIHPNKSGYTLVYDLYVDNDIHQSPYVVKKAIIDFTMQEDLNLIRNIGTFKPQSHYMKGEEHTKHFHGWLEDNGLDSNEFNIHV